MRIVVDAMGSDNMPAADVAGGVMAAREFGDEIILVGDAEKIGQELAKHDVAGLKLTIQHASEAITMEDIPSEVTRSKPDSSAHVGLGLVRDGKADAFVSAGNTGGLLAVATLKTLRRIKGVKRPALGIIFPIANQPLLIDGGANADVKPDWLYQFAVMGSIYVEKVNGVANPRVALVSNGEEEGKGNQLIKDTIPLLANSSLNYIGNIEPKEFVSGVADVVVADGFTGNLILKTTEATASMMSNIIRENIKANPITALGGLLARSAFTKVRKQLSSEEVGGAPLLGVNGPMIIGHGRSDAYAIKQAVRQARKLVEQDIVGTIRAGLETGS